MWLPANIIADVDHVARIHYVDVGMCQRWNEHRRGGELRLLTGWCWTSKDGREFRQGFKTQTICYRDAYYSLVKREGAPPIARPRLRVVSERKVA
jgi:hypothetical protein